MSKSRKPTSDRKERSDSKLGSRLSAGHREQLTELMIDGKNGIREIQRWLLEECQVKVSTDPISKFYERHVVPVIEERRAWSELRAQATIDSAGEVDWDAASFELVRRMNFKMLNSPDFDPDTVDKFLKLVLKRKDQEITERKLSAAAKDKIEVGLDALLAEIQGNPRALLLFNQLKEVVAKA